MSKRRKNAGEGYGYMFHGAFSEKKDAVAKERKTKGAWVKGTMTKHGWRYLVMSPRTNPMKRRKKNPVVKPNPSELLVLGANPHTRELTLPPGSTLTIRMNPLASNPICGAMVQGEQCTRQPGHSGPHLPQGATMRPRSRLRSAWKPRKRNPSAAAIREDFTGSPAEHYTVHQVEGMPMGDYAQLGELLALYVKPKIGGPVQQIDFRHARPLLVCDESARQLFFVGGDQDVTGALSTFGVSPSSSAAGIVELGEARRIDYKQRKEHVPDPDIDEWRHEFGEESGVRPTLWFDLGSRQLFLKGGEYVVRREGIVN